VLAIGLFGGLLAMAVALIRASGIGLWLEAHGCSVAILQPGSGIPYALAIVAGGLVMLPESPLLNGAI
jgi:Flp pilus assembly protein protease CpaA